MPIRFSRVVSMARTLHIYLTMFAFLLMTFFAVTGLTLNHEDWIAGEPRTTRRAIQLPAALLREPDKLGIVEFLRTNGGALGAVSTFDADSASIHVELKGPGRQTDAEIDRKTGQATVVVEGKGLVIRLDDLHRGKDAGGSWSILIDATAVLLLIGSITGILMWFALPRRRRLGLAALAVGTIVVAVVVILTVP